MKQSKYYYLLAAIITLVATVFFFIKDFVVLEFMFEFVFVFIVIKFIAIVTNEKKESKPDEMNDKER